MILWYEDSSIFCENFKLENLHCVDLINLTYKSRPESLHIIPSNHTLKCIDTLNISLIR